MSHSRLRLNEALIEEMNRTEPPYGTLAVWLLGQESIAVKGDGITLYIDPFVSDYVSRVLGLTRQYEAPLTPEHLTNASMCLITHDHEDHLDPGTMEVVRTTSPDCLVVAPRYSKARLLQLGFEPERIMEANTQRMTDSFDGRLQVLAIPAAHEQLEQDADGHHRYVGYVIRLNGVTVYHAGDTLVYDGLTELLQSQRIDLACLPINGRDYYRTRQPIAGNMNYSEAAQLAWEIGADTVIPLHYDTFDWNTEKPGYFVQELYERYPEQKCHLLARGERYVYVSGRSFIRGCE
ncbi:MBL fold metallo-hydrolase [Paenibacillus sp. YYML68]|uniref:MBL fold metallo-hydrolase n=1 Tax=Paenibacillus sp. YYML68 TaxID=2909250 RepID=UPI002491D6A1|nr:MBL fold metallo-hydrolase [Paenibacillus sp. YYML68]